MYNDHSKLSIIDPTRHGRCTRRHIYIYIYIYMWTRAFHVSVT